MKKLYTLLLLAFASLSFGQTIVYEGFNYTPGSNIGGATTTPTDGTGSNGWITHSNTSSTTGVGLPGTIDVLSGNLSYTGILPSSGNKAFLAGSNTTVSRDVNRAFTSSANILYYSALINVIDNTQLSATVDGYFLGFGATSGTALTTLGARLGIKSSNAAANYRLSIQNISGGTPTFTENAVDLSFGTTYLVVVKYDKSAVPTVATLWVNPSSVGGAEPASTVTNNSGTTTFPTFASVYFRNAATTPKAEIDEIKVGVTYADVTSLVLSNKDFGNISGLSIYPNPAKNLLNITSDSIETKQVEIYNILGKSVLSTKVTNAPINVSTLTSGVYIVKITEDGKTATRKLVIQ